MKIKKGDKVKILKGKDNGKTGVVIEARPKEARIVIEGLNIYKKSQRRSAKATSGGIIDAAMPLSVANVTLVCPHCNKTTRVGYKQLADGKTRICRKCKEIIDHK